MRLPVLLTILATSSLLACSGGDEFQSASGTAGANQAGSGGADGGAAGSGAGTAGGGTSGEGGSTAGTAGQAGDAGTGGSAAGSGGEGGDAGVGGSTAGSGGTAGVGGSGGDAGNGGDAGSGGSGQAGAGAAGSAGAAGECTPGEYSCLGDLLRLCNEQGIQEPKEACGNNLCSAENKGCLTCVPGSAKECASTTAQLRCKDDGLGYEEATCGEEAPFCMEGACVQCLETSDCPASTKTCVGPLCLKNKCTEEPLPKDTPLADDKQTAGDCQFKVCDGNALAISVALDTDLPLDDGNDCTAEVCKVGVSDHPALAVGTACGPDGKGVCNGQGICGVCIPGETRCSLENKVETCSVQGQWEASDCALPTPVCSVGACVGVTQVTAGDYHSCALLSDGRVECWGRNNFGQLGNGEAGLDLFTHRPTPVQDLDNVLAIDAGGAHTCAVLKDKRVKCWGDNSSGQLGTGKNSAIIAKTPVLVPDLLNVQQIALGFEFSCAISGTNILCWGKNDKIQAGVLGNATIYNPTQVENGIEGLRIAAGKEHACAITPDQKTYCWGSGEFKQHGKDTFQSTIPALLAGLPAFKSIAAGDKHTCAVSSFGGVLCWGHNNNGQLGMGYTGWDLNPDQFWELPKLTKFNTSLSDKNPKMTMGNEFSCQVIDGSVECVGNSLGLRLGNGKSWVDENTYFTDILKVVEQIGDQPNVNLPNPTLTGVVMADSGFAHSCALKSNGAVYCWGYNAFGQAGTHLGLKSLGPPGLWAVPVIW